MDTKITVHARADNLMRVTNDTRHHQHIPRPLLDNRAE
jgi:hypothetical protein